MHPTQELLNLLLDMHPRLSLANAAAIVKGINDPQAVLDNIDLLVVTFVPEGKASDEDNKTLTREVSRRYAEVRIIVSKRRARVLIGPAWYEFDEKHSVSWDGHCTVPDCKWEFNVYLPASETSRMVSEAREHLTDCH